MKHLVFGLTFAAIALAQHPKVSECFKVHELLRADEEHYWATWTNACPYTIDAVYVTVRFADRSSRELADGVWSLHFIQPGAHRTMRFTAPGKISDFASVHQKNITADIGEAFGRAMTPAPPVVSSMEMAAVAAFRGAVAKDPDSRDRAVQVSAIITDSGEAGYRYQPEPASTAVAAYKEAVLKDVLASSTAPQAVLVARPAIVGDAGEALFRTDFPDPWQAVLSPQESAVSNVPRGSFVRFVSEDKPIFQ
jgi:hypothetical protein